MNKFFLVVLLVTQMVLSASRCSATIWVDGVTVDEANPAHYMAYIRYFTVPKSLQTGPVWNGTNETAIKALEGGVQVQIYTQMRDSSDVFAFTDTDHATGRVLQRMEIIHKMREFNTTPGLYGYGDPINPTPDNPIPHTTASHWQLGKNTSFYFGQKSGTDGGTPYQAITQLCNPPSETYGECFGAMVACLWWGSSQGMGASAFNALYDAPLNMDSDSNDTWQRNFVTAIDIAHTIPGDWGYWKNHNWTEVMRAGFGEADSRRDFFKTQAVIRSEQKYAATNPAIKRWIDPNTTYYWQGENAIYIGRYTSNPDGSLNTPSASGKPYYDGLGLGVSEELGHLPDTRPLSNVEIRHELRKVYNLTFKDLIQGLKNFPLQGDPGASKEPYATFHTKNTEGNHVFNLLEIAEIADDDPLIPSKHMKYLNSFTWIYVKRPTFSK